MVSVISGLNRKRVMYDQVVFDSVNSVALTTTNQI